MSNIIIQDIQCHKPLGLEVQAVEYFLHVNKATSVNKSLQVKRGE